MNDQRWDRLLDRDWASEWDSLEEAPDWAPRRKTAQIPLRLRSSVVERTKQVAAARALPYHALARSWIADGLNGLNTEVAKSADLPQTKQLNLKLDQSLLDALKSQAHQVGSPYHRLARDWIESALEREEKKLGIDATTSQFGLMDVMLLVLHSPNSLGEDAIRGITRLQKLLFVVDRKLNSNMGFYAYNYGPFNEKVGDAAEALRRAGFLQGGASASPTPPTFDEMMSTVVRRSGPSEDQGPQLYALNEEGHSRAEQLRRSSRAYERLYEQLSELRKEWDTAGILERVYEAYPAYTEKSLIKDDVDRRRRRRLSRE